MFSQCLRYLYIRVPDYVDLQRFRSGQEQAKTTDTKSTENVLKENIIRDRKKKRVKKNLDNAIRSYSRT